MQVDTLGEGVVADYVAVLKSLGFSEQQRLLNDQSELVILTLAKGGRKLILLRYDASKLRPETERVDLQDGKLSEVWGPHLNRFRLITKSSAKKDTLPLTFLEAGE